MEALKDVENTLKWKPGVLQGFRSSRQHNSKSPIPEPEIFFLLILNIQDFLSTLFGELDEVERSRCEFG